MHHFGQMRAVDAMGLGDLVDAHQMRRADRGHLQGAQRIIGIIR